MADADIKKIRIKSEELPFIQFDTTKVAATISTVSGNGTTVTYTTAKAHDMLPGDLVFISGVLPVAYNLYNIIDSVPSSTQFTVLNNASGTYVSGGTIETWPASDISSIGTITLPLVYNEWPKQEYINSLKYNFRYRIASEDKNRYSHWSEIQTIIMPDVTTPFPYTSDSRITISKGGNPEVVSAVWTKPASSENPSSYEQIFNKINIFDVWFRWNVENNATSITEGWTSWEFATTVSSNTFSIIKPPLSGFKTIEIAIQIPTTIKTKDYHHNKLTLYKKTGAV